MMNNINSIDYSILDHPLILSMLFYPRKEYGMRSVDDTFEEIDIPTYDGKTVGARLYLAKQDDPTLLFFHGNGEIVEDYDDIAQIYLKLGINFLPVDYRGYGRSTGSPTVTAMMRDCHTIFLFVKELLLKKNMTGKLFVMGRSLGSASAIEIASTYSSEIGGLIVESGFAYIIPLLKLLGIDIDALQISEDKCPSNAKKISIYRGPLLVIHAEKDHIIPFAEGRVLFEKCPSSKKEFLEIKEANHNNIFQYAAREYFDAINRFIKENK